jgi:hypothetical protein
MTGLPGMDGQLLNRKTRSLEKKKNPRRKKKGSDGCEYSSRFIKATSKPTKSNEPTVPSFNQRLDTRIVKNALIATTKVKKARFT